MHRRPLWLLGKLRNKEDVGKRRMQDKAQRFRCHRCASLALYQGRPSVPLTQMCCTPACLNHRPQILAGNFHPNPCWEGLSPATSRWPHTPHAQVLGSTSNTTLTERFEKASSLSTSWRCRGWIWETSACRSDVQLLSHLFKDYISICQARPRRFWRGVGVDCDYLPTSY